MYMYLEKITTSTSSNHQPSTSTWNFGFFVWTFSFFWTLRKGFWTELVLFVCSNRTPARKKKKRFSVVLPQKGKIFFFFSTFEPFSRKKKTNKTYFFSPTRSPARKKRTKSCAKMTKKHATAALYVCDVRSPFRQGFWSFSFGKNDEAKRTRRKQ